MNHSICISCWRFLILLKTKLHHYHSNLPFFVNYISGLRYFKYGRKIHYSMMMIMIFKTRGLFFFGLDPLTFSYILTDILIDDTHNIIHVPINIINSSAEVPNSIINKINNLNTSFTQHLCQAGQLLYI